MNLKYTQFEFHLTEANWVRDKKRAIFIVCGERKNTVSMQRKSSFSYRKKIPGLLKQIIFSKLYIWISIIFHFASGVLLLCQIFFDLIWLPSSKKLRVWTETHWENKKKKSRMIIRIFRGGGGRTKD